MSIIHFKPQSHRFTHLWERARKNPHLCLCVTENGLDFFPIREFGHGSELAPKVIFDPMAEDPNKFSVKLSGNVSVRYFCSEIRNRKPECWIRLIRIDCYGGYIFVSYNQTLESESVSLPIKMLGDASEVWL